MIEQKNIAVIIPTYKAEKTIAQVIKGIPDFVDKVIIVDDKSPDATAKIAEKFLSDRVKLIRLKENQGVGGATLAGFREAEKYDIDILVKMDSDNQMDPIFLPHLIHPLLNKEADLTKGNRFLYVRELASMPPIRILGNFFLSLFTKVSSGYWQIFDPTNGYIALNANSFQFLQINNLDKRFFFESSLLNEAGLNRFVVKDIYITAKYQEENSNLSEIHSFFIFPKKLLIASIKRFWIQYIVRDFGVATLYSLSGISAVIFGFAFGLYHWIDSYLAKVETPTGTVMLAILPIIIGIQMLIQAIVIDIQNQPQDPRCRDKNIIIK